MSRIWTGWVWGAAEQSNGDVPWASGSMSMELTGKAWGGRYNWESSMQFDAAWHYGYILSKDSKGNKWVKDQGWKCWEDKNFQNGRREEEDQGKETEKTWSEKEVEGQEKQRGKSRVMEWREESEREEGQVEKRGKGERTTRGVLKITQGGSWSRMRGEWMEMSVYYVLCVWHWARYLQNYSIKYL